MNDRYRLHDAERKPENMPDLTDRQLRESEYYAKYVNKLDIADVSFDPVESTRGRPWNPYWYVYEFVKEHYKNERNKLLDFGCGCGTASLRFAKMGYDVSSFDLSEDSLDIARALSRRYDLEKKISFTRQISEQLNYPSGYFDIIVGFDILHHIDIRKSISECSRVLKHGGIAVFKEPVESYAIEEIRNTRLVKYLFPKDVCYTPGRHITQDERKLDKADIDLIGEYFEFSIDERFTMISKLDILLRKYYGTHASPLEKLDRAIFRVLPSLKRFGGDAVFILKKR